MRLRLLLVVRRSHSSNERLDRLIAYTYGIRALPLPSPGRFTGHFTIYYYLNVLNKPANGVDLGCLYRWLGGLHH